jgi:hypothetical protein
MTPPKFRIATKIFVVIRCRWGRSTSALVFYSLTCASDPKKTGVLPQNSDRTPIYVSIDFVRPFENLTSSTRRPRPC